MNTIKICTDDNRVIDVNEKELIEIIKTNNMEKIEIFHAETGWDWLQNWLSSLGWDDDETIADNVHNVFPELNEFYN